MEIGVSESSRNPPFAPAADPLRQILAEDAEERAELAAAAVAATIGRFVPTRGGEARDL
jgi:hypothetical protein